MPSSVLAWIFIFCRLHHTRLPTYMREMKKYHLAHHYKNFELGFGVTSMSNRYWVRLLSDARDAGKIWDYIFNTVLPV